MPSEAGYSSQVGPAGGGNLPRAGGDAFGVGVGSAIEGAGAAWRAAGDRQAEADRRLNQQREAADVAVKLAQARADHGKVDVDLRTNAAPGGAGHTAAIGKDWEERSKPILDAITDPELRMRTQEQVANYGAAATENAYGWEQGQATAKSITDAGDFINTDANTARHTADPKQLEVVAVAGIQTIHSWPGLPADVRDKLERQYNQSLDIGHLNGMLDRGEVAQAKALVDSGAYDKTLTPEQLDSIRNGVEVETRRVEAQQAQAVAVQQRADRETVATINANLAGGIEVDPNTIKTAMVAAQGRGDTSTATQLGVALIQQQTLKVAKAQTPQQRDEWLGRLSAVKNPSAEQQATRAYLERVKGGLDGQFNNDRAGFFTANGHPPPAWDPAHPETTEARRRWAASTASEFLTNNDASAIKRLADGSPAERLQAASMLSAIPGYEALTAARRVAPGDAALGALVRVRPDDRPLVQAGVELRKARADLIDGKAGEAARQTFDALVGGAFRQIGGDDQRAAFETARNLYASLANQNGVQAFDRDRFVNVVQRSLGATQRRDGWHGGIVDVGTGNRVMLNPDVPQRGFGLAWSRMSWGKDQGPVFADGKTRMTPTQVREYSPVLQPDGRYRFEGPGGVVLQGADRAPWTLDLAMLAKRVHQ